MEVWGAFYLWFIIHGTAGTKLWVDSVLDLVRAEFSRPQILVLFGSTSNHTGRSRALLAKDEVEPFENVLRALRSNWSLLVCEESYSPPPKDVGYFRTQKTAQIIAVVSTELATTPTNLKVEIALWKTNPSWSGKAAILVVVQNGGEGLKQDRGEELARNVIVELWLQAKSLNVVVMVERKGQVDVFASEAYTPKCSVQVKSVKTPLYGSLFSTREMWNLNQCEIVAACTDFPPYVYSPDPSHPFTHGFEVMLFHALADMMNFSYSFIKSPHGESPWVAFLQNGEPAGLIGRLHRHEADFAFFGMRLTWVRYQVVDIIDAYYGAGFVWAAPLQELAPPWHSFYVVFEPLMWLATVVSLVASTVVFSVLSGTGGSKSAFVMWASMVNTDLPCASPRQLLRLFLTVYFLYVLNVTAAYQSGLYRVLTSGLSMDSVESVMEASREGYISNIYPSTIPEMQVSRPDFYRYITTQQLVNWTEDHVSALGRIALQRRQVALLPTTVVEYETDRRFTSSGGKPLVRILREPYGVYETVFHMARDHPLKSTVQVATRRLVECGWVEHFVRKERPRGDLTAASSKGDANGKALVISQLLGAFVLLVLLLLFTIVVFMGELAWERILLHRESAKRI